MSSPSIDHTYTLKRPPTVLEMGKIEDAVNDDDLRTCNDLQIEWYDAQRLEGRDEHTAARKRYCKQRMIDFYNTHSQTMTEDDWRSKDDAESNELKIEASTANEESDSFWADFVIPAQAPKTVTSDAEHFGYEPVSYQFSVYVDLSKKKDGNERDISVDGNESGIKSDYSISIHPPVQDCTSIWAGSTRRPSKTQYAGSKPSLSELAKTEDTPNQG